MAEGSREKPGGAGASSFAPKGPRASVHPDPLGGPPASDRDRTVMQVPDPATQQPADEGTMMMVGNTSIVGPQIGSQGGIEVPSPRPHRGPYGSAPEPPFPHMPAMPGSQPPPGYLMPPMPMMPGSRAPMPGSQAPLPGSQPPMTGHPQIPPTGPGFRPGPLPVMGPPTVLLQGRPDPRLVLLTEPDSARAVSFRLLRDNLLAKRLPRVLAVSSAAKGDGKTICAMNLALSLAERAKVLLIEGNLIQPELATIFCIPESTQVWPMNAPWLAPYRVVEVARLHVAAILTPPGQPPPRFEKQWFEQLIGALRRFNYDFIIIDAAAFSVSPTVSQMVATADATLLAVRSGTTTARALRRANDQIPEGKAIGIALIDAMVRP